MVNSTDPADQLQWLVHILQEAENKGEKVELQILKPNSWLWLTSAMKFKKKFEKVKSSLVHNCFWYLHNT